MLTVGNNELGEKIESIECEHCGAIHSIQYGTTRTLKDDGTWSAPVDDKLLGFYKCGEKSYLASIKGRAIH